VKIKAAAAAGVVLVALYVIEAATRFAPESVHAVVSNWFPVALYALAVALCARRARRDADDRLAWTLMASGIGSYGLGQIVFVIAGGTAYDNAPIPAHVLWLAFYPLAYAAVQVLLRRRISHFPRSVWLDGLIGLLTLAGLVDALALPAIHSTTAEGSGQTGALLLYPIGDLVLLMFGLIGLSLARWRGGWSWSFIAGAFALFALNDIAMIVITAERTYDVTSVAATGYPIAALLIGVAALRTPAAMPRGATAGPGLLVLPGICVAINVLFMLVDQFVTFPNDDVILPAPAILLGMARAAMTLGEVRRLYESRRFERGFEDATVGMAIVDTDMRYVRVNDAYCRMLGYSADEMLQRTTISLTYSDDLESTRG
jgi:PAS domain-containing protein